MAHLKLAGRIILTSASQNGTDWDVVFDFADLRGAFIASQISVNDLVYIFAQEYDPAMQTLQYKIVNITSVVGSIVTCTIRYDDLHESEPDLTFLTGLKHVVSSPADNGLGLTVPPSAQDLGNDAIAFDILNLNTLHDGHHGGEGTTYGISAETATGGANLRLTGSDASTDEVKLAAGSNVTIDRTDANTITISATGGSGGGAVSSVAGRTGDVVLTKEDVGLGNANNTSDLEKPISTDTQTALDGKLAAPITYLTVVTDSSHNTEAYTILPARRMYIGFSSTFGNEGTHYVRLPSKSLSKIGDRIHIYSTFITEGKTIVIEAETLQGIGGPPSWAWRPVMTIAAPTGSGGYTLNAGEFEFQNNTVDGPSWGKVYGNSVFFDVGAGYSEVARGNHRHGKISSDGRITITNDGVNAVLNAPLISDNNGYIQAGTFGTGANTFCQGNDSRLSDTRNTTNSITFNNSGTGAASSATFNGSTAITVSHNTIGAAASGHSHSEATTTSSGFLSIADKTKLDGIASGAEVNVQPNWTETNNASDSFILNKPTTLAGYGITDAAPLTHVTDESVHLTSSQNTLLDSITASATEINYLSGVTSAIQTQLDGKQATLESGTNIKTINGTSILGAGDITITSSNPLTVSSNVGLSLTNDTLSTIYNTTISDTVQSVAVGGAAATAASTWKTKTIVQVLDDILFPDVLPTYTVPTITLTGSQSGTKEVGEVISQALTLAGIKNDAGAFLLLNIFRSGVSSGAVGNTSSPTTQGETAVPDQFGYVNPNTPNIRYTYAITDTFTVGIGTTTWNGISNYNSGLAKKNNKGITDTRPAVVRTTTAPQAGTSGFGSNTLSVTGIYPYYWGVSTTQPTTTTIAAAIQDGSANRVLADSTGTVSITFNAAGQYVWFAHAGIYTAKTKWYNTELNQGSIGAGNFILAPVDQNMTANNGRWTNVSFKVYISGGATNTSGAIQFRNT